MPARYADIGSERELCHVYTAQIGGDGDGVSADPDEVADWRWVTPETLEAELADADAALTPWLRIEWPRLRRCLDG